MPAERKEMPLQRLAVLLERLPHLFLHGQYRGHVIGTIKIDRRAADLSYRFRRVNGPQFGFGFVAHRRIIADKSAYLRRCGDKMYSDAAAHAITADRDSFLVHVRLGQQMTPALREHACKLGIGSLGLNLRAGFDMSRGRITQLLENVDRKCAVPLLRELARLSLDVLTKSTLWMDQKQRWPWLLSLWIGQISGYPVLLGVV